MHSSDKAKLIVTVSAAILTALIVFAFWRDTTKPISSREFTHLLHEKKIAKIVARGSAYYLADDTGDRYKIVRSQVDPRLLADYAIATDEGSPYLWMLLLTLVGIGGASLLLRYWMKHRNTAAERSAAVEANVQGEDEVVRPVVSNVTFDDIGGIGDVKEELEEIIDFLKNPARYRNFGARLPKGVLLVGPPGVGKTMIAKAVAAEADVPFYYQSASSFVHIYVGMGAKRVSRLFRAAAANAPAIVFIDEIDAVGKQREGSGNDEREATLNQLLTEMDGFADSSGVIVIAATNKIEVLDPALLRAGRFDRRVFVDLPTPGEREAIVEKYLRHIPNDVEPEAVAQMTVGFSGAALAALINEGALHALRRGKRMMQLDDIAAVKDKVAFGKRRMPVLDEEQKRCRAVYLSGKAVTAAWYDLPFEKVMLGSDSIRPAISEPLLRHEIEAHVRMLLAGRIVCELHFGEHASSAKNDLAAAVRLVEAMLFEYGMGETLLPPREATSQTLIRLEEETQALLASKVKIVEAVTAVLLERESVSKDEIKAKIDAFL